MFFACNLLINYRNFFPFVFSFVLFCLFVFFFFKKRQTIASIGRDFVSFLLICSNCNVWFGILCKFTNKISPIETHSTPQLNTRSSNAFYWCFFSYFITPFLPQLSITWWWKICHYLTIKLIIVKAEYPRKYKKCIKHNKIEDGGRKRRKID